MPIDHERIRENGWAQGRLFSAEDTARVSGQETSTAQFVLVSHDCDIAHTGSNEPQVEVCLAERLEDGPEGTFRWARNPRRLELGADCNGVEVGLRLLARDRQQIDRAILEAYKPDDCMLLAESEKTNLVKWLAKRYARTALPDSFNNRIRPAQSNLRKVLKRDGDILSALMIATKPHGEIDESESYEIHLVGLMLDADYSNSQKRDRVESAVNRIAEHLDGCEGIEVVDVDALSEADFSLHDLRHFVELGYDDLSLRSDPPDPMVPTG